jgi:hypothetical protein
MIASMRVHSLTLLWAAMVLQTTSRAAKKLMIAEKQLVYFFQVYFPESLSGESRVNERVSFHQANLQNQ